MKKVVTGIILTTGLILVGCSSEKKEVFTQEATGMKAEVEISHKEDVVNSMEMTIKFDNEAFGISDKKAAQEVADTMNPPKEFGKAKLEFDDKETKLSFKASDKALKEGESYTDVEKEMKDQGFKKK